MGGVLDRNGDGVHLMAIFHPEGVAMELEQIGTASPGFQNRLGQLNRLEVVKFELRVPQDADEVIPMKSHQAPSPSTEDDGPGPPWSSSTSY